MPAKHSKNNTARGFYTKHESKRAGWGSRRKRLSANSLRPWFQCALCLETARDPLVCPRGTTYCRGCIAQNLLVQKTRIKKEKREEEEKKLEAPKQTVATSTAAGVETAADTTGSFWMPARRNTDANAARAEAAKIREAKVVKQRAQCPSCDAAHPLKLKSLIALQFTKSDTGFVCGACNDDLAATSTVAAATRCGHIVCRRCALLAARKHKQCPICAEPVTKPSRAALALLSRCVRALR
ncbi:MAG: hypothetical protein MHM6MM_002076 [Cercozoa sp. M6MM]